MFGAIANIITGLLLVIIGLTLTIAEFDMTLLATLGLVLLIGGAVQLLVARLG